MPTYKYDRSIDVILSRKRQAKAEPRTDTFPSDDSLHDWIFDKFGYPYRDLVRIIGYFDHRRRRHLRSELHYTVPYCTVIARQVRVERIVRAEAKDLAWQEKQLYEFLGRALAVEMHVDDPRWASTSFSDGRPDRYRLR